MRLFDLVLVSYRLRRLPLHVAWGISTPALERDNMIHDVPWARTASLSCGRTRVLFHEVVSRFHRWFATLRVLGIEEIKTVPYAPVSHPFVERLIGTIRREYLDHAFFWNTVDLARKLSEFRDYYNEHRVHRSLDGTMPALRASASAPASAVLDRYGWRQHCRGLFQTPIAV